MASFFDVLPTKVGRFVLLSLWTSEHGVRHHPDGHTSIMEGAHIGTLIGTVFGLAPKPRPDTSATDGEDYSKGYLSLTPFIPR